MADYTTPITITPGAAALASDWNTYIRDNTINLNDRLTAVENGEIPPGSVLPKVSSSSSDIQLDFSQGIELIRSTRQDTLTITGVNYQAGVTKTIIWNGGSSARDVNFPANWVFVSFKPTQLDADKRGVITVTCHGTSESDCTAAWAAEI